MDTVSLCVIFAYFCIFFSSFYLFRTEIVVMNLHQEITSKSSEACLFLSSSAPTKVIYNLGHSWKWLKINSFLKNDLTTAFLLHSQQFCKLNWCSVEMQIIICNMMNPGRISISCFFLSRFLFIICVVNVWFSTNKSWLLDILVLLFCFIYIEHFYIVDTWAN